MLLQEIAQLVCANGADRRRGNLWNGVVGAHSSCVREIVQSWCHGSHERHHASRLCGFDCSSSPLIDGSTISFECMDLRPVEWSVEKDNLAPCLFAKRTELCPCMDFNDF